MTGIVRHTRWRERDIYSSKLDGFKSQRPMLHRDGPLRSPETLKAMMKRLLLVPVLLALTLSAQAQVTVTQPWVRATVAQQMATGAFVSLRAASDSRLVAARTAAAGVVEIHEMSMDGNTMKMRAVPGLDLPAGQLVELRPGAYHLMLMDLKQPMKAGESLPLTLVFEARDKKRHSVEVQAEVRPLGGK